jgi:hypothetical protein
MLGVFIFWAQRRAAQVRRLNGEFILVLGDQGLQAILGLDGIEKFAVEHALFIGALALGLGHAALPVVDAGMDLNGGGEAVVHLGENSLALN